MALSRRSHTLNPSFLCEFILQIVLEGLIPFLVVFNPTNGKLQAAGADVAAQLTLGWTSYITMPALVVLLTSTDWGIKTSNPLWQALRWLLPRSPIARIWVSWSSGEDAELSALFASLTAYCKPGRVKYCTVRAMASSLCSYRMILTPLHHLCNAPGLRHVHQGEMGHQWQRFECGYTPTL